MSLPGRCAMARASRVLAVQLLPWLVASVATAQSDPPVPKQAAAAAQAMVARFVDSWNRADGVAYGENYWPDAELVDPTGVISRGKAAIVQEHVDLWAGTFKETHVAG